MLAVWGLRPTHPPGCCYNGNPRHRNWFKWLLRTFPISSEVVPFPGIRVCWVSKLTNGKSNWKPAETCRNLPKPIWGFPDSAVEPLWLKLWAANVSCCRNRSASCSHNTSTTELGSWHLKTYQKTVVIWPNPIDLDGIGGPYWLSSQPPNRGPDMPYCRSCGLNTMWMERYYKLNKYKASSWLAGPSLCFSLQSSHQSNHTDRFLMALLFGTSKSC